MPLVSPEERDPARCWPARIAWSFVRDGDRLRVCRIRGRAATCYAPTLTEWRIGGGWIDAFRRESGRGARVVAGLEPHRVLLRTLTSPLKDRTKSAEIWVSLLDAAIPFALEECLYAFAPPVPDPAGGFRCLAAAARIRDVHDALEEWEELGIHPDLLVPEAAMLRGALEAPPGSTCLVWQGERRAIFLAEQDGNFLGASGSLDPSTRESSLSRFLSAWPDMAVRRIGPTGDDPGATNLLETLLARSAQRSSPHTLNLRAGPLLTPSMAERLRRTRRTVRVAFILCLVVALVGPWILRQRLRAAQSAVRTDMAKIYRVLTGADSPAPGQEILLARRYLESAIGPLRERANLLATPPVTPHLATLLTLAQQSGILYRAISIDAKTFTATAEGPEDSLRMLAERLNRAGWSCEAPEATADGVWILRGRTP